MVGRATPSGCLENPEEVDVRKSSPSSGYTSPHKTGASSKQYGESDYAESDGGEASEEPGGPGESDTRTVYKCPNCGERLSAFTSTCPACGYELRGVVKDSRAYELTKKLELAETVEQRKDLIRNYYVSNTREDIYEFIILASSNIESDGPEADAWRAKLDQAYGKAVLVFEEGPELDRIKKLYEKTSLQHIAKSSFDAILQNRALQCGALFIAGIVLRVAGSILSAIPGIGGAFDVLPTLAAFLFIAAIVLLFRLVKDRKEK